MLQFAGIAQFVILVSILSPLALQAISQALMGASERLWEQNFLQIHSCFHHIPEATNLQM
jgi:hypothetical protein